MFDRSNTLLADRAEDQSLVTAINDVRKQHPKMDAMATQFLDDFDFTKSPLRHWIFELCDPSPRASPFMTDDDLAAFAHEVSTKGKESARWAELPRTERRRARQTERFARDKRRVWMDRGRSQNVDRSLILYVIRRIEEATGVTFRFSRPAPLFSLGGPMLRLAEAALLRLFLFADRAPNYLGLVSPARHYKRKEIVRTAELARRARRTSPGSPINWSSDLILAFRSDVRAELAGKGRQENKDQGTASPSSRDVAAIKALLANPWVDLREALEAAAAAERQIPSGIDILQANIESGAQPDLIELAKRKMPRFDDH